MTKLLQKELVRINCPHCKQEIAGAWICQLDSILGIRYVYLCGICEKLLGISLQKNINTIYLGDKFAAQLPFE